MLRDRFTKDVAKTVITLALAILACRFSRGYFSVVIVALGLIWAFQDKVSLAFACFVLCPYMVVMNPFILPKTGIMGLSLRFGPLLMGLLLALSSARRPGRHMIPLAGLFLYFVCAFVSSIGGYCFRISMLKLVNQAVYLIAIIIGTRNLCARPYEVSRFRVFFMALSVLSIVGSFATLPFPAVAYPLTSQWLMFGENGVDLAEANAIMSESDQGMTLFAGFFMHSQTAAPMFACIFAYVLCDMIEYAKKVSYLHVLMLLGSFVCLFMTRSRTGLLAFLAASGIVVFYMKDRVPLPKNVRIKLRSAINIGILLMVVGCVTMELRSQMFSRWILKTDDLESSASFGSSVFDRITASRQGLIANNLADFRENPLLGMGFQVDANSVVFASRKGLALSAPIEKGLLPLMVLGETGVIGGMVFLLVILSFYAVCIRKKYLATLTLMTCFLAVNMGESTFFSPGGVGGILWAYSCVGGFSLDMLVIAQGRTLAGRRG